MAFPVVAAEGGGAGLGEVHFLTGENGTGKTRILCLLAAACGNRDPLLRRFPGAVQESRAVVVGASKGKVGRWLLGASAIQWRTPHRSAEDSPDTEEAVGGRYTEHMVHERTGELSLAVDPRSNRRTAALAFRGMATVKEEEIQAMAPVNVRSHGSLLDFDGAAKGDVSVCQSMANLKMAAAMETLRPARNGETRAVRLMRRLESAVAGITGRSFSFEVVPNPKVRLKAIWGGVSMDLGQLPDGLRAIIGWLVSCVAKLDAINPEDPDPLGSPVILLLDEPEGHLHPAWQRKVLPAAQQLLPRSQIFVATHSPFVISSVNAGWIHVFRAKDDGRVAIDPPLPCGLGDSYLDVVEDILGVKEWYDPETEGLLREFRDRRAALLARERGERQNGAMEGLRDLAKRIADRGESLKAIMGREMRQVERELAPERTP